DLQGRVEQVRRGIQRQLSGPSGLLVAGRDRGGSPGEHPRRDPGVPRRRQRDGERRRTRGRSRRL
ncbi:MAG: hypothetical protein AVDCRST_MAG68-2329, partial [uncultured Gemmatimonadetes bacterium]